MPRKAVIYGYERLAGIAHYELSDQGTSVQALLRVRLLRYFSTHAVAELPCARELGPIQERRHPLSKVSLPGTCLANTIYADHK